MGHHRPLTLSLCLLATLAPTAAGAATYSTSHQMTGGSTNPSLGAPVGSVDQSFLMSIEVPTSSGSDTGPRFTGELMYGWQNPAPDMRLSLGGRFGLGAHRGDNPVWLLDAVPDVKLRYSAAELLGFYGDLGVGLAYLSTADSSLALTFQFGGGVSYALSPNVNLLGEVRFNFYTKSGSHWFISVPTIGFQFHQ